MTAEEFRLLRDLIHDFCGIFFREEMKYLLERRLAPRLKLHGLSDYSAYYRFLRFDPGRARELDEAVEVLTTNETYFFREESQLVAFRDEVLPELAERNADARRLRLWSAGCSTGEEPYTLAMLVQESGRFEGWDVEIFGNDISRKVLAAARKAEYGAHALRATDPQRIERFFEQSGERYRVRDELRRLVSFGRLNLLDAQMIGLLGRMDAIFCRNVLIYFDLEARRRVLGLFYGRLKPGGYLFLGHSESLIHLSTDFELAHLSRDLVYRRPASVPGRGQP
ncbi:MAG: protein-glutamate O-methyltransferase CheR [Deltaproteobacteria bacterium]|nr:MAG: protein-glutamate O-methyltransferase CheR [Deltaproteobacteria bacterium]